MTTVKMRCSKPITGAPEAFEDFVRDLRSDPHEGEGL